MAEFKKLSEVEQLESASDNATVLIEEGGDIKRVPKSAVGGVGGYIATVTMADLEMSTYDMMFISENYDALYDVLNAGGSAWIDLSVINGMAPSNVMSGSGSDTPSDLHPSVFGKMAGAIISWVITDVGLICDAMVDGGFIPVMFPNGSHNLEKSQSSNPS